MGRSNHSETLPASWADEDTPVTVDRFHPADVDDLVRLGRDFDGGYVVSKASIAEADIILSFGVNDDISFEAACSRLRPGLRIVCFDPTVTVGSLAKRSLRLGMVSLGCLLAGRLGAARRKYAFARRFFEFTSFLRGPDRTLHPLWVAETDGPGAASVGTIIRDHCKPSDRIFIKMDIEGSEYGCLDGLLPHADRITGLAVEFHTVVERWAAFAPVVDRLRLEFCLVHAHGNNFDGYAAGTDVPNTLELSFVARRLLSAFPAPSSRSYPIRGLDMPNHHRLPDLSLRFRPSPGR